MVGFGRRNERVYKGTKDVTVFINISYQTTSPLRGALQELFLFHSVNLKTKKVIVSEFD